MFESKARRPPKKIASASPSASYKTHQKAIQRALRKVLEKAHYILGPEVTAFEREFAEFIGARHAIGVASGTDALFLALRACGVGPGDYVVTVSHTAVATIAAIELTGAEPILVDVDPQTYTMDPEDLKRVLKKYSNVKSNGLVKAVIAVHLYGQPAAMSAILKIAKNDGLYVVEDCAQSAGAAIHGRRTGCLGDIAAFSFYPTKNLGALGDGGAVVTQNNKLAEKVRLLREYGWKKRYISSLPGTNSRLDELQAAILRVKLPYLDRENKQRQKIAQCYRSLLVSSAIQLPQPSIGTEHCYHQFVIQIAKRNSLKDSLEHSGISTLIHYPMPVHLQPAYRGRVRLSPKGLPCTEALRKKILSLPIYPELSIRDTQGVAEKILAWQMKKAG